MLRTGISLLILALACRVAAQPPAVRIAVMNESTSMPFTTAFSTPVHPGVELGMEWTWRESARFRVYPVVTTGYLFHRHLYQALYVQTHLGLDLKTGFGLNMKTALGVGYMHTFTTQQEYRLENGHYQARIDRGNSRVTPALTLGLGYRLKPTITPSPEIFTLYQTWIEYPYSPGFISVMPHTNLQVGYKFYPF